MSTSRGYRSKLRDEQAQRTRLLIRRAALELFKGQGFNGTTVAHIADRAHVSVPTVYAVFESKAGIIAALLDEMEQGVQMEQRFGKIIEERDPYRQIGLWLDAHCALFENNHALLRAAMEAIGAPEVRALTERGDGHRRDALDALTSTWEPAGMLRPALSRNEAAERMYLLSTVQNYLAAIDELGWSTEWYKAWLTDVVAREVLRDQYLP